MHKKQEAKVYFKELLEEGEELLWAEKPALIPNVEVMVVIQGAGILWLLMDTGFIQNFPHFSLFSLAFMIFHLTPFWLSCLVSWLSYQKYKHTLYAYSEKRIFIKSGKGANYTIINFDEIILLESRAGFIDNKYSVGSIIMHVGKEKAERFKKVEVLYSIPKPVATLKDLRKRSQLQ